MENEISSKIEPNTQKIKSRVLVIDDDEGVREAIKRCLSVSERVSGSVQLSAKRAAIFGKEADIKELPLWRYDNFEVILSDSSDHGVSHVKQAIESGDPFQIIFLDIRMPGMSGDECALHIREIDKNVGVCFITGFSDINASELAKKMGGDLDKIFFLKKPFDDEEIRQIARAFSAKWFAERKSKIFNENIKNLTNSILILKDVPLYDLSKQLKTILRYILSFMNSKDGFIARVEPNGRLVFVVGVGKFASSELKNNQDSLSSIYSKMDMENNFFIKKAGNSVMLPLATIRNKRVIVILDDENTFAENDYFIKIFTENATAILTNIELIQNIEQEKKSLEVRVKERTTDLESAYRKLDKMHKDLRETTAHLIHSEKLTALGELSAGVAHELNQPLNGIKIICQSLLRDIQRNCMEENELKRDLSDVVGQVDGMAEIINHMIVFTRNTEGKPKEIVDLNRVIEGPLKLLGQQLKDHNIIIKKYFDADLPKITGISVDLEQVFMNLISNARHALGACKKKERSVVIKTYKTFDPHDQGGDPVVAAEITDNGIGIPANIKGKIFQAFFTTHAPGQGTGLGLSVSYKIVEEHKGKIKCKSVPGEGTTFTVLLPANGENS